MKITHPIKVKNVIPNNGVSVCRGKLILVEVGYEDILTPYIEVKVPNGLMRVNPIVISETEEIEVLDLVYSINYKKIRDCADLEEKKYLNFVGKVYKKVIATSENLTSEQLKDIVDGKLNDGDEVLIECYNEAEDEDGYGGYKNGRIKLNEGKVNAIKENYTLKDRLFNLANDFAIAKYGDIAVKLHKIHNGLMS